MNKYLIPVIGLLIEVAALLAFIKVGQNDGSGASKVMVFIAFLFVMGLFLWSLAKTQLTRFIIISCALFSSGFFVAVEILGRTIYPGLVKEMDLFSPERLLALFAGTCILFLGYVTITFLFGLIQYKKSRKKVVRLEEK